MQMIEVQSSNVAAVGYDADIATLAVRYKDGSLYIRPNVTATEFGALVTAPSKGKFLAAMTGKSIRIERGKAEDSQSKERAAPLAAEITGPLNVLPEFAGKCCARRFANLDKVGGLDGRNVWICADCGAEYESGMVGPLRHWRVKPFFAVIPRG